MLISQVSVISLLTSLRLSLPFQFVIAAARFQCYFRQLPQRYKISYQLKFVFLYFKFKDFEMPSRKAWSFTMLSVDVMIIALLIWATQRTVGLEVCTKSKESCTATANDYPNFIGRYTFPTTPIETFECRSEEAIAEMKRGVSVDKSCI